MDYASKRRTFTVKYGTAHRESGRRSRPQALQLEAEVINVACEVVHTFGASQNEKREWLGECQTQDRGEYFSK